MLVNLVIGEFGFTYHVPETLKLFLADKLFRVHSMGVSVLPFPSPNRIHPLHNFILTLFSIAGMWMHFFLQIRSMVCLTTTTCSSYDVVRASIQASKDRNGNGRIPPEIHQGKVSENDFTQHPCSEYK